MAASNSIPRTELIRKLKNAGYLGPFIGKDYLFMKNGMKYIHIPGPGHPKIHASLLAKILKNAGIDKDQWDKL